MYDELETLWKRLGVPDAEIDAFVELNRGTTEEAVAAVSCRAGCSLWIALTNAPIV